MPTTVRIRARAAAALAVTAMLIGAGVVAAAPANAATLAAEVSAVDLSEDVPVATAVTADGATAYVSVLASPTTGAVLVVDTATQTVTGSVADVTGLTGDIAVIPGADRAYVLSADPTSPEPGEVLIIDTTTDDVSGVVGAFPDGVVPLALAVAPDGDFAYVATAAGVLVIDTATDAVIETVPTRADSATVLAADIAVAPDGAQLYETVVDSDGDSSVVVIDTAPDYAEVGFFPVPDGGQPIAVAASPTAPLAWVTVATGGGGYLAQLDPASDTLTASSITFDATPGPIAFTSDGLAALVGTPEAVLIVDVDAARVTGEVDGFTGTGPVAVVVDGGTAYVANALSSTLSTVSLVEVGPIGASLSPASGPTAGGQTVTISGGQLGGVTSVTFGGRAATIVAVATDGSSVTVLTPAAPAGAVDVTVTDSVDSFVFAAGYTYVATPTPPIRVLSPTG